MRMRNDLMGRVFWGMGNLMVMAYALLPVLWIISLSLKQSRHLNDQRFFPQTISLENYRIIFSDMQFPAALWNSLGIAVISTVLAVTLGMFAAYAIVRLEFPGRRLILAGALATAMFPSVVIIGPIFNMWRTVGLFDTWLGLIIPYMTFALPLAIWILSAFFREIPWELDKAARVDGATPWQAFIRVIVPLAAPAIFTAAILVFIFAWNDFLFAISLTSTNNARTVPAVIAFFTGSSRFELPTGLIAAASVVITVPVLIIVLIFQQRIVAGLTSGAVKG
ncbi:MULTISPECIES: carbohydrate ABC transporter permease [Nitrosomonas]|uniref:Multiple sugar transport system permease protein n=1 Tax=Nitrosomonas communis TaxID=44574 RepID=A0A0F7KBL7_9PROT|nr:MULTISPECIES: carbohydrate ABC transporter permease [Nitrosomonas]AKH37001.1 sugar ABC transporter permease [Nitrosomonas communis]TYP93222.1 multiple sugar transport system permease protein [Nitrosomonas communis]